MMHQSVDEIFDETHNQNTIVFNNKLANRTKYEFELVKKCGFAITCVCLCFMVFLLKFAGRIMTGAVLLRRNADVTCIISTSITYTLIGMAWCT